MKRSNTNMINWFRFSILIGFALIICIMCGCSTKKRMKATESMRSETNFIQKDTLKESNEKKFVVTTIDTTKKHTNKSEVVSITTTEREYDKETSKISKEKQTKVTKSTTYMSEDDLYFIQNGEFKDSTETNRYNETISNYIEEKEKETDEKMVRRNKIAKCIGLSLLLLIFIFVSGSIIYKKVKQKIK